MDELLELYETMGISPAVYAYGERTLEKLKDRFAAIDQVAEHNQAKVLCGHAEKPGHRRLLCRNHRLRL